MDYFRDNIEAMVGYVPGFQPTASEVVKLNTNENPYPPSPKVMEAISRLRPEQLRRYPDPFAERFRAEAAGLAGVEPANIICTNGGDELLRMAVTGICDERRAMAYPVPTYTLYPVLAAVQGCPAIEVPFDSEFNLPAKLARTGAALTILCNPNAPSCSAIPAVEIAQLAQELKGVLLIDEAYVDFADGSCVELVRQFDNVLILRSMSKGYSLAGMRFGYGIGDERLIAGLAKLKDSYPVDAAAIEAATAAICDQAYFKENIAKIKAERTRLTAGLRGLGLDVPDSQTNFVLARCVGQSAEAVFTALADEAIFVRYFKLPQLEDKLRITVGTPEQNDRLLAALNPILTAQR